MRAASDGVTTIGKKGLREIGTQVLVHLRVPHACAVQGLGGNARERWHSRILPNFSLRMHRAPEHAYAPGPNPITYREFVEESVDQSFLPLTASLLVRSCRRCTRRTLSSDRCTFRSVIVRSQPSRFLRPKQFIPWNSTVNLAVAVGIAGFTVAQCASSRNNNGTYTRSSLGLKTEKGANIDFLRNFDLTMLSSFAFSGSEAEVTKFQWDQETGALLYRRSCWPRLSKLTNVPIQPRGGGGEAGVTLD